MTPQEAETELRRLYADHNAADPDNTLPNALALSVAVEMAREIDAAGWPVSEVDLDAVGGFAVYAEACNRLAWGVARNSGASYWILTAHGTDLPVASTDTAAGAVAFLREGSRGGSHTSEAQP